MQTIEVKTGLGYFTDSNGRITEKAQLPKGVQPLSDGYTYTEVVSQEELDVVEVYVLPKTDEQLKEEVIQIEIRAQAISSLKTKGVLDSAGSMIKVPNESLNP